MTPIIFIKALFYHSLQKKSWRAISQLLNTNHIALHSFHQNYCDDTQIKEIFHYFAKSRVIVYVADRKTFSNEQIDNSNEFLELTLQELNHIL